MNSRINVIDDCTCPGCGAQANWNADTNALVCPYCHRVSQLVVRPEPHRGPPLPKGPEMGWETERKTVCCQSCGAISVLDPDQSALVCSFCAYPGLKAADHLPQPARPVGLLPFLVSEDKARAAVEMWYASNLMAPSKLAGEAITDPLAGIYVPYLEPAAHAGFVYGSVGVPHALLQAIAPFPVAINLVAYDPSYIKGWVVERHRVDLAAAERANRNVTDSAGRRLTSDEDAAPTPLNVAAAKYSPQTFKSVLLPVWLFAYTHHDKIYRIAVNGYTGKISGEAPQSQIKATIVIVIALLLLAAWFHHLLSA